MSWAILGLGSCAYHRLLLASLCVTLLTAMSYVTFMEYGVTIFATDYDSKSAPPNISSAVPTTTVTLVRNATILSGSRSPSTNTTAAPAPTLEVRRDKTKTEEEVESPEVCTTFVRQAYLEKKCQQFNMGHDARMWNPKLYSRFMVDDTHRLLYCVVPKAGCTSTKFILAMATGNADREWIEANPNRLHTRYMGDIGIRWMTKMKMADIDWRYSAYYKFVVVRHPYERLYSAWRDKFGAEWKAYGRTYYETILSFYPDTPKFASGQLDFSFERFLSMIVSGLLNQQDVHWRRQVDHCHPCMFNFNYIARQETFEDDMATFLLPKLDLSEVPRLQPGGAQMEAAQEARNISTLLVAMRDVPKDLKDKVRIYYKDDFELFGYDWDDERGSTCQIKDGDHTCC